MANMGYEEHLPAQTPAGAMSERAHSPWQGDYDFPPSVGPVRDFLLIASFFCFINILFFYRLKNSK